jgi:hypothetical protein
LDEALESARRLITCDERGCYAIAHPRLKQYLRARIDADDSSLLDDAERRLLELCGAWQQQPSSYALAFYSGHLLEKALDQTQASDATRAALFQLVDDDKWYAAQSSADPSGAAYATDLFCARHAAEDVDKYAAQRGTPASLLTREVWCALASASLHGLSSNVPTALLTRLATHPARREAAMAMAEPRPGGEM